MELTLSELVLMILAGSVLLVTVFALISRMWRVAGQARAASRRVVCRLCLHAFEVDGEDALMDCPKCGARNDRRVSRLG